MKIAIITSGFLPVVDGVTVSGLHRVQYLSQWKHEILLFCPDYSSLAHVYPNWQKYTGTLLPGVNVINLDSTPFMDLDFERNVSWQGYKTLLKELEKFQPDLIHVDEAERLFVGFWRIPGVDFARKNRIPCVSFFRTNFLEYLEDFFPFRGIILEVVQKLFKQFLTWVYNSYDATLIHSVVTHKKLIDIGIKNSIYAELSGFDSTIFEPKLRAADFFGRVYQLPQVDRTVKLIFLGRLTPDKGWNFTFEAFATVSKIVALDNVAILVIGDGPMRDEIAQKLSVFTANIHLLGRVSPEHIPALLANSDIHITASEKETRGLTVLEAFASGIPVLAPRAGGVVENIDDGKNGFLFTPKDSQDFAQKLKQLVENPELRQAMGENARVSIASCSWEQAVKNLVRIWQDQIAKNKSDKVVWSSSVSNFVK
ncbi:MAG: glycosyltransferase [Prochloraceae cyanobacterium]